MSLPPADPSHAAPYPPLHAGTLELVPVTGSPGLFRSTSPVGSEGEVTLLVECDAPEYPFQRHCRFVRQKTPGAPYTFTSLEFRDEPPGIRLGPWPGWRGIPEMPAFEAEFGGSRQKLTVMFWGDELTRKFLRASGVFRQGGSGSVEVRSEDPLLIPRRVHVYRTRTVHAQPLPVTLRPELHGVHPRLLLTPEQVVPLRKRAAGTHQVFSTAILTLLGHWDLPYEQTPESKAADGPQRLSPEDRVLLSAWAALIEPGRDTVGRALRAYSEYVLLTQQPGYEPLRIDTQSGEVLFILSVGYDLLCGSMTPHQKETARTRLFEVAEICRDYLGEERRDFAQAHFLGCGLGLLAFSFLFWDEHPRAAEWASRLRGAFDVTLRLLPADGFYPHGINLWIYEFGQLLRWLELFRVCSGEDLWRSTPGIPNASEFRGATLSPDGLHGVTMGDPQFRVGGDSWCHFLIASRTGSQTAQWVGEKLLDLPHAGVDVRNVPARRRVYEFLYYDPSVGTQSPAALHFPDGGQVCVREGSTLFVYRSGPPLGAQCYGAGEYGGYGHSDPCNGAFLIYAGQTFVASGPGPVYRRDSALHNLVTINGQGQVGDSTVWMPDFLPPEVLAGRPEVRSERGCILLSAETAPAYLPHLGVVQCRRAVCVSGGSFVLGVDVVQCREVSSIEWNAHSWSPFARIPGELRFELDAGVRLLILDPTTGSWETGVSEYIPAYPNPGKCEHRMRVWVNAREARFVWCYLLEDLLPPVIEREPELRCVFPGGPVVRFDGERLIPAVTETREKP